MTHERPLTLDEWRDEIKKNAPHVDHHTMSHNIITISLGAIEKHFGKEEANKAVRDFKLERFGWEQH